MQKKENAYVENERIVQQAPLTKFLRLIYRKDLRFAQREKIVLYLTKFFYTVAVGRQHAAHTDNVACKINICFSLFSQQQQVGPDSILWGLIA